MRHTKKTIAQSIFRKWWNSRQGQALVEMVLALPVMALFAYGSIAVYLDINAHNTVQQAAADASRLAAAGNDAAVGPAVESVLDSGMGLHPSNVIVDITNKVSTSASSSSTLFPLRMMNYFFSFIPGQKTPSTSSVSSSSPPLPTSGQYAVVTIINHVASPDASSSSWTPGDLMEKMRSTFFGESSSGSSSSHNVTSTTLGTTDVSLEYVGYQPIGPANILKGILPESSDFTISNIVLP
ncbi:MAG: pilus assembly protein, partial [Firmicutes bacterium]|nr:pilus assembly protein [Bacillota bacterium]